MKIITLDDLKNEFGDKEIAYISKDIDFEKVCSILLYDLGKPIALYYLALKLANNMFYEPEDFEGLEYFIPEVSFIFLENGKVYIFLEDEKKNSNFIKNELNKIDVFISKAIELQQKKLTGESART